MAIVLDSSASVTQEEFARIKKFASDLAKHFKISKDRTRVAAFSFSQYVHTGRNFNDEASMESVLKAIEGLPYEGSSTRIDFALEKLLGQTFTKVGGARNRDQGTH